MSILNTLKANFPVWQIKNRGKVATELSLSGGTDSITILPGATASILSSQIYQMPDMKKFTLVVPSMADVVSAQTAIVNED